MAISREGSLVRPFSVHTLVCRAGTYGCQDGLSSAALFSEMVVALRKQVQLHELAERSAGDSTPIAVQ